MKNIDLCYKIIQSLVDHGVKDFIICAGARNSPFVFCLENQEAISVFSFYEERSAAFFALGRYLATGRPAAVITTSGTAAAELLPAAIEANYSGWPVVLVTADRPSFYRGSGAPQTIEQVGIFHDYVDMSLDIEEEFDEKALDQWTKQKAVHLNVCLKEPLIDAPQNKAIEPMKKSIVRFQPVEQKNSSIEQWLKSLGSLKRPLVILGSLPPNKADVVKSFVLKLKVPIYAESLSQLRGNKELKSLEIESGDHGISNYLATGVFDSVIRIGGVPTLRSWRDLEDRLNFVPVYSMGMNEYSGLARKSSHCSYLGQFSEAHFANLDLNFSVNLDAVKADDKKSFAKLAELIKSYPLSEPALVNSLSRQISNSNIYVGNSLPIREWDWVGDREAVNNKYFGNRGANGIDGQISTFLGSVNSTTENWCVVGDLTAMYDLAALWATPMVTSKSLRIVVINNGGGKIFDRMFKKDIFLNRHNLNFEHWAKMYGWSYVMTNSITGDLHLPDLPTVIELVPSEVETKSFYTDWETYCKS
jgi:2-succinyl-5-enolpyruvyl-6-hydroxy-3-cyclohexene-1-carboxylate synthase